MTIRQYAKRVGFKIVGKLRPTYPLGKPNRKREIYWRDDAGTEYYRSPDGESCCIVPYDSAAVI